MKKIGINLFVKLSVIIAILLIAFSLFYQYVVFIPKKEIQKQESEFSKKFETDIIYLCVRVAHTIIIKKDG